MKKNSLELPFSVKSDKLTQKFKQLSENLRDMVQVPKLKENYGLITIIPRARVGYEMIDSQRGAEVALIISYPTSASGIIALLKTPPKYRKLD